MKNSNVSIKPVLTTRLAKIAQNILSDLSR